jgi:hypothetical protein
MKTEPEKAGPDHFTTGFGILVGFHIKFGYFSGGTTTGLDIEFITGLVKGNNFSRPLLPLKHGRFQFEI